VGAVVTGGTLEAPGMELPPPLPPPQADNAEAAIKETRARRAIADVETKITGPPVDDGLSSRGVYRMSAVWRRPERPNRGSSFIMELPKVLID